MVKAFRDTRTIFRPDPEVRRVRAKEESRKKEKWPDPTRRKAVHLRQNQSSTVWNAVLLTGVFDFHLPDEPQKNRLPLFSSFMLRCAMLAVRKLDISRPRHAARLFTLYFLLAWGQFSLNWDSTEPRPWWVHLDPLAYHRAASTTRANNIFYFGSRVIHDDWSNSASGIFADIFGCAVKAFWLGRKLISRFTYMH